MTPYQLLTEATRLHNSVKPTKGGTRPANWKEVMSQACALRKQAYVLDPKYDPKHDHFMRFYWDIGVI